MESVLLVILLAIVSSILAGYYFGYLGYKNGEAKGFMFAADIQLDLLKVFSENYTGGHNEENDISHMVYDIQWVNFHSLIPKPMNQDLVVIKAEDFKSLVLKAMKSDRN